LGETLEKYPIYSRVGGQQSKEKDLKWPLKSWCTTK